MSAVAFSPDGKTLAYLVPAIQLAAQHRLRVVISTHTRNLQQQIIARDAPRVRDVVRWARQIIGA